MRGPQGTRYGANALAGLVNIRTRSPSDEFEFNGEIQLGDDNALSAGLAFGGPIGDQSLRYRIVAQQYSSDGFRQNVFLGRSDTNEPNLVRQVIEYTDFPLNQPFEFYAVSNGDVPVVMLKSEY